MELNTREAPVRQQSFAGKKMTKQLTGKRDNGPLHLAARAGDLGLVVEIMSNCGEEELNELLSKQNYAGETALYLAAGCGYVGLVKEMMKYYDVGAASIKAGNGCDAFHVASKQGHLEVLKILMEAIPELSMTVDRANTTALHIAAAQGHTEVVSFLLETGCSLMSIARSNGKTALHSAARKGHLEVVQALLSKDTGTAIRKDRKGQTALHMAVKGQNVELVDELAKANPSSINEVDNKGNTALHVATGKGRAQIVRTLLSYKGVAKTIINRSGESVFDTAEKSGHSKIATILAEHGIQSAKSMKLPTLNPNRELKQTVSEIKHEVHDQLKQTRQTRKKVHEMVKRLGKMHSEGLNNAINSTTVVAVLTATVAFAAIFSVPGQYPDPKKPLPDGFSPGEANIAPKTEFIVFFIFDSFALFISLAVVVVQTSIVVVEREAKERLMAVINKLMWMACVMVSVAFLALSYVIVGKEEKWLAVGVTAIGTVIMGMTLGTMCYWMVVQRVEASKYRCHIRRSSLSIHSRSHSNSNSHSCSFSEISDSELLNTEFKTFSAVPMAVRGPSCPSSAHPPLHCTYCNFDYHTRDTCHKLHGYPVGHPLHGQPWRPPRRATASSSSRSHAPSSPPQQPRFSASRPHNFTQAHHVQGTQAPASSSTPATHQVHGTQPTLHDLQLAMPDLSTEQHSRVLAALRDTTTPPQANAVLTTDFAQGLLPVTSRHGQWILDSGATDHITSSASCLVNRSPSHLPPVSLPSGASAPITFTGTLPLNSSVTLKDVLCVPNF